MVFNTLLYIQPHRHIPRSLSPTIMRARAPSLPPTFLYFLPHNKWANKSVMKINSAGGGWFALAINACLLLLLVPLCPCFPALGKRPKRLPVTPRGSPSVELQRGAGAQNENKSDFIAGNPDEETWIQFGLWKKVVDLLEGREGFFSCERLMLFGGRRIFNPPEKSNSTKD